MTMLERAVNVLKSKPDQVWTLDEIRRATGIALRTQYRLSLQLQDDPRVQAVSGRRFALKPYTKVWEEAREEAADKLLRLTL